MTGTQLLPTGHNERHTDTRKPVAKIIHNFGRTDNLNREQLVRLCRSIARVCGLAVLDPMDPEQNRALSAENGLPEDVKIRGTVSLGCVFVIESLQERLGLKRTFSEIARRNRLKVPYERTLLAMTANRLCDPESKLGVWDRWLSKVYLPTCDGLKLKQMYEALEADRQSKHRAQVVELLGYELSR